MENNRNLINREVSGGEPDMIKNNFHSVFDTWRTCNDDFPICTCFRSKRPKPMKFIQKTVQKFLLPLLGISCIMTSGWAVYLPHQLASVSADVRTGYLQTADWEQRSRRPVLALRQG